MPDQTIFTKQDNNTIIINEFKPTVIISGYFLPPKRYDYSFLLKQKNDIQNQWDFQISGKYKEIDEINVARSGEMVFVDKLISESNKLGIVAKTEISPIETQPSGAK